MAEFAAVLQPTDLLTGHARPRHSPLPPRVLESLIRFEGALAWEGGAPRSAVPSMVVGWAQEVWLAGWDEMYGLYGSREG